MTTEDAPAQQRDFSKAGSVGSNPGPATSQLHDLGQATYLVCTSVSFSADGDEKGPTSNSSGEDESCERRLRGECSSISSGCNTGWETLPQPGFQVQLPADLQLWFSEAQSQQRGQKR